MLRYVVNLNHVISTKLMATSSGSVASRRILRVSALEKLEIKEKLRNVNATSAMILRYLTLRHGRMATAARSRRRCVRSVTTQVDRIESLIENRTNEAASIGAKLGPPQTDLNTPEGQAEAKVPEAIENFATWKRIQKSTGSLGSVLESHYEPNKLITQPPSPKEVTLELLMASQAHIGHATSLWNPANQRYIYGIRQGVHIISLEVIAAHLRRAAKVVEGVAYHGGLILFVGTRPGQHRAVVNAAEQSQGCHLFERWIAGSITNADQLLTSSQMKIVDEFDNELKGEIFNEKLRDRRSLKPDLVVVMNPLENYILLHECSLNNIPTIGVIDTDADPTWVTYPIPANDDSLRSINLICGVLGRAGGAGRKKRLEAAKSGKITWRTDGELIGWVNEQKAFEKEKLKKSEQ